MLRKLVCVDFYSPLGEDVRECYNVVLDACCLV